ncbi:MAG TPA: pitrilysin family protein [Polyangiaceae bacterium]|jgi:zinc protease|nr:pitrilysin family protein [Polyangiaceae bacterium]
MRARFIFFGWGALLALGIAETACGSPPAPHAALPPPAPTASALPPPAPVDPEAFRNTPPATGTPAPVLFPAPAVKLLKNGVTLYVVPKHSAVATLSVVVREGAASLPPGKSGLAALTARMLTEGTQKRSSLALAEASESLGSTLEADAGRDESHVSIATLTGDVTRGLELLAEVTFTPAFRAKDFERVKNEWLDGLRAERQEPPRLASLVALRTLLGASAGAPVSGSIPDVEKLKSEDLVAFHKQAYVPANLAVIAVGDLTLAALEPDVERLFGRATGPSLPPPSTAVSEQKPNQLRILIVDRKDSVQTSIFAVQPFPKRSEPGFEAREIMGTLLGGLFTSRLNLNLREKHAFTYGVHGQAIATRSWGAFFVATDVKTETTADSLTEILNELERARDPSRGAPIQAQEAARARTDLMHSLGARLEHTSQIADSMRTEIAEQLPPDYYAKYPDLVAQVPTAQVAREAARLDPAHLLIVLVGDRAQIEPSMKQHGFTLEAAEPKLLE